MLLKSRKAAEKIIGVLITVALLAVLAFILINIFVNKGAKPLQNITSEIISCKGVGGIVDGEEGTCIPLGTPCKGIKINGFGCKDDKPMCCFAE